VAKIKLNPSPTFDAVVNIPVPGSDPVPVCFTFKHRTRTQVREWFEAAIDAEDVQTILDIATGWELDDEFSKANISALCENYAGAPRAVLQVYLDELRGARTKN